MSLPNARSVEHAGALGSPEGWLSQAPLPELLARAFRSAFTGVLMLEPPGVEPSSIGLLEGAVVRADGPWKSREAEWSVLERFLPPETREFAAQHAEQYQVAPFQAVERLLLLPRESLDTAREALTVVGVQAMGGLPGDARFRFLPPPSDGDAEPEVRVEPLGLLVACLLVDPQRERSARSLALFEHAPLSLEVETARRLLPTLQGPVRAVLECLVLSPGTLQSLRERHIVSSDELVASVCALWITGVVTVRGHGGSQTFPAVRPSMRPPQAASSIPPFSPVSSSLPPPRRESGFARSEHDAVLGGAKELAMELKVEEAWMRAEADPSRAQQISAVLVKAISVYPRNPRFRYYLARLHIQANRLDEARAELERVVALDPTDTQSESELEGLRARLKERQA